MKSKIPRGCDLEIGESLRLAIFKKRKHAKEVVCRLSKTKLTEKCGLRVEPCQEGIGILVFPVSSNGISGPNIGMLTICNLRYYLPADDVHGLPCQRGKENEQIEKVNLVNCESMMDWVDKVVLAVNELDYNIDPAQPDLLFLTEQELRSILLVYAPIKDKILATLKEVTEERDLYYARIVHLETVRDEWERRYVDLKVERDVPFS